MEIIITYDVPNKHNDVKTEMFNLGYKDKFSDGTAYVYLPNTTLYHASKTPAIARDEMKAVCLRLNVKLERCISTSMGNWAAIYGEPFK